MKKVKIAMNIPIPNDPTSWYRGVGPMQELQKTMRESLDYIFPSPWDWPTVRFADIAFFQRPCMPEHLSQVEMALNLGVKVWIDWDDDNLSVPKDNPSYMQYAQMHVKEAIVKMARAADIVTVSTEALKKKYSVYSKNVVLIPNALSDILLKHRNLAKNRQKLVLWRGTATHRYNLAHLVNEVVAGAIRHKDFKFGFFGYDPLEITDQLNSKSYLVYPQHDILNYFRIIPQLHPTLVWYSLASNDHAQSRSHVSWLEASFADSAYLGPDILEFQRPGALNFATPQQFTEKLNAVLTGEIDAKAQAETSWACIMDQYLLSKVNAKRREVVELLMS